MDRRVTRLTAVACLLLLAGCTRGGVASAPDPSAPTADPSATAASNEPAAQAEAVRILDLFHPPAGATRLPGPPLSAPVLAKPAGGMPMTVNVVDRAAWWTVRGDAATVLTAIV